VDDAIKGRIDMLATGIRTPVGVKIFGPDLAVLERLGREVEGHLQMVPGTRSVFAERAVSGYTWTSTSTAPRRRATG
jgi:Cu(I)/Ag(I) efflux system membrane protein CusA/SilA